MECRDFHIMQVIINAVFIAALYLVLRTKEDKK